MLEDRIVPSAPNTDIWTGNVLTLSGLAFWNDSANWENQQTFQPVLPSAGDNLVFGGATANTLTDNDFSSGTLFNSITVEDSGYSISGNAVRVNSFTCSGLQSFVEDATLALETNLTVQTTATVAPLSSVTLGNNGNNGTLTVNAGASFTIEGTVAVQNGSTLDDNGLLTVNTTGVLTGQEVGGGGINVNVASGASMTIQGILALTPSTTMNLTGSLIVDSTGVVIDQGFISMDSNSDLTVQGALTIDQNGTLAAASTLTVGASGALTDLGHLDVDSASALADLGVLTLATGGNLADDGTIEVRQSGTLTNLGTLDDDQTFNIDAGGFVQENGLFTVEANATAQVAGRLTVGAGGHLGIDGSLTVADDSILDDQGTVDEDFGSLSVFGRLAVEGDLTVTSGVTGTGAVDVNNGATVGTFHGVVKFPTAIPIANPVFLSGKFTLEGLLTLQGAVTLDDDVTLTGANSTITFAGAIGDDGNGFGFTDAQFGVVVLDAANIYTGATTINNGTLEVNGSLASTSAVNVSSGGTLAGTGKVGSVSVASGGTVRPGTINTATGILTAKTVTFDAGSTLAIFVAGSSSANTTSDRLKVTGALTLAATSTITIDVSKLTAKSAKVRVLQFGTVSGNTKHETITLNPSNTFSLAAVFGTKTLTIHLKAV